MPDNRSAVVTLLWVSGCIILFALQVSVLLSATLGYDLPWLFSALDGSVGKLLLSLLLGTLAVCLFLTAGTIAGLYYPGMSYDQFVSLVGHLTGVATLFIIEGLSLATWGFLQLSGVVQGREILGKTLTGKVVFLVAGTGPFLVWLLQSERSQDAWRSMVDGRKPRLDAYRPYILIHTWVGRAFAGLMLLILVVLIGVASLAR